MLAFAAARSSRRRPPGNHRRRHRHAHRRHREPDARRQRGRHAGGYAGVAEGARRPVYRWPGGNFVSGYNWRDGLGDPDRRPPRKNPAWKGIEHNDFGIDEYLAFCRLLGTEPYITVNSGLGDVQTAVEELQYANAPATTPLGSLRAKYGHAAPYGVRFWSIGNEMYGKWQLGHMPLDQYVAKHNQFADAMRAVDPSIKLIAVGDVGPWSEGMLKNCADHMDLISEHFYCHLKPDLAAHVRQIPDNVRRKVAAHRDYRKRIESLQGKDIRIALDEWNYWYGPDVFGQIGTRIPQKHPGNRRRLERNGPQ